MGAASIIVKVTLSLFIEVSILFIEVMHGNDVFIYL